MKVGPSTGSKPRLLLCNSVRVCQGKGTKMEEVKPLVSVYEPDPIIFRQFTLVQVPKRDVESGFAQDPQARKIAGRQIYPFLIERKAYLGFVESQCEASLRPPIEECQTLVTPSYADEAEVEHSKPAEVLVRRSFSIENG